MVKKNWIKIGVLLLGATFVAPGVTRAQNKLGDNPAVYQAGSLLELESLTKGLRLPRVPLNDVHVWTLDGTAVSGMLIYNESGTAPKGLYYWSTDLAQWVKVTNATEAVAQAGSIAGVTGYTQTSGNFSMAGSGTFATGSGTVSLNGDAVLSSGKSLTLTSLPATLLKTNSSGVVSPAVAGVDYQAVLSNPLTSTSTSATAGQLAVFNGLGNQVIATTTLPAATVPAFTGDVISSAGSLATTLSKLQGKALVISSPASGQVLQYDGTNWVNATSAAAGSLSLASGVSGTDVNFSTPSVALGGTLTLNIPDAGNTPATRGLVSAGTQTFYGAKTFNSSIIAPTLNSVNGLNINAGALSGIAGYAQTSGNFAMSGNGTFATGTGTVSLNGDAVLSSGKSLTLSGVSAALLKTNSSGVVSPAVAGTDYQAVLANPITATAANAGANQLAVFNGSGDQVVATSTLPTPALPAFTGDVASSAGSATITVNKLQNSPLAISNPQAGNLLKFDGSNWVNSAPTALGNVTFATGMSGTDVNFGGSPVALGGTLTLNIPDAGNTSSTRGLVNTGTQTFYGSKIFNSSISAPTSNTINGLNVNSGALSGVTGYSQGSGNFAMSGAGTFGTGTGTVSLNGNTVLSSGKSLTMTSLPSTLLKTDASGVVVPAESGVDYQGPLGNPVTAITASYGADQLAVFSGSGYQIKGTYYLPTSALPAFTGDVSSSPGSSSVTVHKLQNSPLSISNPQAGHFLKFDGSNWVNSAPTALGTVSLALGTSGNDVNVGGSPVALGGTLTLNIPDASGSARGLVNAGAQTFNGVKTFASSIVAPTSNTINGLNVSSGSVSGVTGYSQGSGSFSMTGGGTFATGTGAVTLNGNTTVSGGNTLNVGTGATNLGGSLTVAGATTLNGAVTVNGSLNGAPAYNAGIGTTIDFSRSNFAYTTSSTTHFNLSGMKDGGTYVLVVLGSGSSGIASFTQGSLVFSAVNDMSVMIDKKALFTFMVVANSVFVKCDQF